MPSWVAIATEFRKYHQDPLNVCAHLVTSPLAILGLTASVATVVPLACVGFHALWIASLLPTVPSKLWFAAAVLQAAVCAAALQAVALGALGAISGFVVFAVAYVSQDVAHYLTSEQTYQSSYQGKSDELWTLLAHTHHLVPLCFDACWHTRGGSLASLIVQRRQVVYTSLRGKTDKTHAELLSSMKKVGEWALEQKPPLDRTTHWWPTQLSKSAEEAFYRCSRSKELMADLFEGLYPRESHVVQPLEGMNEVYVACKTHKGGNSDTVFFMDHVDGPYGVVPFVHVYRCMAACTPNEQIQTVFPLIGGRTNFALNTGDLVAFDFNRELHRISLVEGATENANQRVCMKMHYLVYPKALAPLGKLLGRMTTDYNANFRRLFVATIAPNSLVSRAMAKCVLLGTKLFNSVESTVGWSVLPYLLTVGAVAALCRSYTPLFYGTSFVHYLVYIATYHQRTGIAYGAFKRDALLFKTLALTQAVAQYATLADLRSPDYASLLLFAFGFGLATLAAYRLGVDRTYFGWELGETHGECVLRFPYGTVPHPMILGGCIGWLGFHKLAAFRAAWPCYAPLHVAFYLTHALQEHLAIHSNGKLQREKKAD